MSEADIALGAPDDDALGLRWRLGPRRSGSTVLAPPSCWTTAHGSCPTAW